MECRWRKTRLPWKQGTAVESHAGSGTTPVASLPPHAISFHQKDWSALHIECLPLETRKRLPVGQYLLHPWPLSYLLTWLHGYSPDLSSYAISTPCPHWSRPKSSRAASETDCSEWPTCRGELVFM